VEPPQQIIERVQVTRQLVFAATQTFGQKFTVNDVMDLMTGSRQIEGGERLRVRQSIAAAMVSLHECGELLKVEGRRAPWPAPDRLAKGRTERQRACEQGSRMKSGEVSPRDGRSSGVGGE
jgi:hypothetical protein